MIRNKNKKTMTFLGFKRQLFRRSFAAFLALMVLFSSIGTEVLRVFVVDFQTVSEVQAQAPGAGGDDFLETDPAGQYLGAGGLGTSFNQGTNPNFKVATNLTFLFGDILDTCRVRISVLGVYNNPGGVSEIVGAEKVEFEAVNIGTSVRLVPPNGLYASPGHIVVEDLDNTTYAGNGNSQLELKLVTQGNRRNAAGVQGAGGAFTATAGYHRVLFEAGEINGGCSGDFSSQIIDIQVNAAAACGNSVVEGAEVCDDGNTTGGDGCSANCLSNEQCGNNTIDAGVGEVCDDGNTTGGDGCSANCQSDESCGNNITDPGEGCDDANASQTDQCNNACQLTECGDGITQALNGNGGSEQCDDGNGANNDTCNTSCNLTTCGDGVVQTPNGNGGNEQCDDGNTTAGDGCDATCQIEIPPACGDGNLDPGEACDDGNTTAGDGCNATCTSDEQCGTGVVDPGEACDDGNTTGGDGCDAVCQIECGNGTIETAEECDGANLGGQTCEGLGFTGGNLSCLSSCAYDRSVCTGGGGGARIVGDGLFTSIFDSECPEGEELVDVDPETGEAVCEPVSGERRPVSDEEEDEEEETNILVTGPAFVVGPPGQQMIPPEEKPDCDECQKLNEELKKLQEQVKEANKRLLDKIRQIQEILRGKGAESEKKNTGRAEWLPYEELIDAAKSPQEKAALEAELFQILKNKLKRYREDLKGRYEDLKKALQDLREIVNSTAYQECLLSYPVGQEPACIEKYSVCFECSVDTSELKSLIQQKNKMMINRAAQELAIQRINQRLGEINQALRSANTVEANALRNERASLQQQLQALTSDEKYNLEKIDLQIRREMMVIRALRNECRMNAARLGVSLCPAVNEAGEEIDPLNERLPNPAENACEECVKLAVQVQQLIRPYEEAKKKVEDLMPLPLQLRDADFQKSRAYREFKEAEKIFDDLFQEINRIKSALYDCNDRNAEAGLNCPKYEFPNFYYYNDCAGCQKIPGLERQLLERLQNAQTGERASELRSQLRKAQSELKKVQRQYQSLLQKREKLFAKEKKIRNHVKKAQAEVAGLSGVPKQRLQQRFRAYSDRLLAKANAIAEIIRPIDQQLDRYVTQIAQLEALIQALKDGLNFDDLQEEYDRLVENYQYCPSKCELVRPGRPAAPQDPGGGDSDPSEPDPGQEEAEEDAEDDFDMGPDDPEEAEEDSDQRVQKKIANACEKVVVAFENLQSRLQALFGQTSQVSIDSRARLSAALEKLQPLYDKCKPPREEDPTIEDLQKDGEDLVDGFDDLTDDELEETGLTDIRIDECLECDQELLQQYQKWVNAIKRHPKSVKLRLLFVRWERVHEAQLKIMKEKCAVKAGNGVCGEVPDEKFPCTVCEGVKAIADEIAEQYRKIELAPESVKPAMREQVRQWLLRNRHKLRQYQVCRDFIRELSNASVDANHSVLRECTLENIDLSLLDGGPKSPDKPLPEGVIGGGGDVVVNPCPSCDQEFIDLYNSRVKELNDAYVSPSRSVRVDGVVLTYADLKQYFEEWLQYPDVARSIAQMFECAREIAQPDAQRLDVCPQITARRTDEGDLTPENLPRAQVQETACQKVSKQISDLQQQIRQRYQEGLVLLQSLRAQQNQTALRSAEEALKQELDRMVVQLNKHMVEKKNVCPVACGPCEMVGVSEQQKADYRYIVQQLLQIKVKIAEINQLPANVRLLSQNRQIIRRLYRQAQDFYKQYLKWKIANQAAYEQIIACSLSKDGLVCPKEFELDPYYSSNQIDVGYPDDLVPEGETAPEPYTVLELLPPPAAEEECPECLGLGNPAVQPLVQEYFRLLALAEGNSLEADKGQDLNRLKRTGLSNADTRQGFLDRIRKESEDFGLLDAQMIETAVIQADSFFTDIAQRLDTATTEADYNALLERLQQAKEAGQTGYDELSDYLRGQGISLEKMLASAPASSRDPQQDIDNLNEWISKNAQLYQALRNCQKALRAGKNQCVELSRAEPSADLEENLGDEKPAADLEDPEFEASGEVQTPLTNEEETACRTYKQKYFEIDQIRDNRASYDDDQLTPEAAAQVAQLELDLARLRQQIPDLDRCVRVSVDLNLPGDGAQERPEKKDCEDFLKLSKQLEELVQIPEQDLTDAQRENGQNLQEGLRSLRDQGVTDQSCQKLQVSLTGEQPEVVSQPQVDDCDLLVSLRKDYEAAVEEFRGNADERIRESLRLLEKSMRALSNRIRDTNKDIPQACQKVMLADTRGLNEKACPDLQKRYRLFIAMIRKLQKAAFSSEKKIRILSETVRRFEGLQFDLDGRLTQSSTERLREVFEIFKTPAVKPPAKQASSASWWSQLLSRMIPFASAQEEKGVQVPEYSSCLSLLRVNPILRYGYGSDDFFRTTSYRDRLQAAQCVMAYPPLRGDVSDTSFEFAESGLVPMSDSTYSDCLIAFSKAQEDRTADVMKVNSCAQLVPTLFVNPGPLRGSAARSGDGLGSSIASEAVDLDGVLRAFEADFGSLDDDSTEPFFDLSPFLRGDDIDFDLLEGRFDRFLVDVYGTDEELELESFSGVNRVIRMETGEPMTVAMMAALKLKTMGITLPEPTPGESWYEPAFQEAVSRGFVSASDDPAREPNLEEVKALFFGELPGGYYALDAPDLELAFITEADVDADQAPQRIEDFGDEEAPFDSTLANVSAFACQLFAPDVSLTSPRPGVMWYEACLNRWGVENDDPTRLLSADEMIYFLFEQYDRESGDQVFQEMRALGEEDLWNELADDIIREFGAGEDEAVSVIDEDQKLLEIFLDLEERYGLSESSDLIPLESTANAINLVFESFQKLMEVSFGSRDLQQLDLSEVSLDAVGNNSSSSEEGDIPDEVFDPNAPYASYEVEECDDDQPELSCYLPSLFDLSP